MEVSILPDADTRLNTLEALLGFPFRDRAVLLKALVHRSSVLERERDSLPPIEIESNERLEFLGDAVINLLVAQYAYQRFADYDEGQLTEVRSALARRTALALLAEEVGLGDLVYMSRSERRGKGRGRATVLAEALEAVVGAIFLDRGLEAAQAFFGRLLHDHVDALLASARDLNAKAQLQELAQVSLRLIPAYDLLERRGPAHDSCFTVRVRAGGYSAFGEGTSKQAAEQQAARELLQQLAPSLQQSATELVGEVEP